MATLSSILALENSIDRGLRQATVHGVAKSDMTERLSMHARVHTHIPHLHTLHNVSYTIKNLRKIKFLFPPVLFCNFLLRALFSLNVLAKSSGIKGYFW